MWKQRVGGWEQEKKRRQGRKIRRLGQESSYERTVRTPTSKMMVITVNYDLICVF